MGFEPTTTWIQFMSSTRTQSQLCTATPISSFIQCQVSFRLLPSSVATFILTEIFLEAITWVWQNELINLVFTTEGFFEIAIESWREWDLNPRPCEFRSWVQLALRNRFVQLPQFHRLESGFISAISFVSRHVYFNRIFSWDNHMSVMELNDT